MAEALKVNSCLTTVNFQFNSLCVAGARELSEALKANTSLTSLNLGSNTIDDEGAMALAEALKVNARLTTLILCDNAIITAGARHLAEALKVNTSLTTLDLRGNPIPEDDAALSAIARALFMNAKPTMALTLDTRLTVQGNVHIKLLQLSGEVAACLELPPCTLVSELEPLAVAAVGNPDRRVSLVLPGGKGLLRHFPADHRLETLLD
jgi:hypothetical protein